jgi:hypothetical protein
MDTIYNYNNYEIILKKCVDSVYIQFLDKQLFKIYANTYIDIDVIKLTMGNLDMFYKVMSTVFESCITTNKDDKSTLEIFPSMKKLKLSIHHKFYLEFIFDLQLNLVEDEQHRIELLMDKVQFKEITRLKKDLEESGTRLEKELDKLKELENKIDNLNGKNKKLEDQLGKIKQENQEKLETLYSKTNIILQDENIYTPKNGYTKNYGKLDKIHVNTESYIIANVEFYGIQDHTNYLPKSTYACVNNYGDWIIYYNHANNSNEITKIKGTYILPDFIIKEINNYHPQSTRGVPCYHQFISMCKMNAENYYKQVYYKELIFNSL